METSQGHVWSWQIISYGRRCNFDIGAASSEDDAKRRALCALAQVLQDGNEPENVTIRMHFPNKPADVWRWDGAVAVAEFCRKAEHLIDWDIPDSPSAGLPMFSGLSRKDVASAPEPEKGRQ